MAIKIYPYRQGSQSARSLAEQLGARVLRVDGSSRYQYRPRDTVINWGSSSCPFPCLNPPEAIQTASNKLLSFELFTECGLQDVTPAYWTNREDIPDDAFPIVCRTMLQAHSGNGIVIANTRAELVRAELYVKYVKKNREYRVHVGRTVDNRFPIIKIQRKARRLDVPDSQVNWKVRNLAGGFIYALDDENNVPRSIITAAQRVFSCFGLDFGAVDVIYNEASEHPYVLEVNTACGLEGSTVEAYTRFFNERIN